MSFFITLVFSIIFFYLLIVVLLKWSIHQWHSLEEGFHSFKGSLLFSPGIANEQKKLYGTQFHPEVDLTERGMEMLRNFLFEIAGCTSNFTVQNREQACIDEIKEKVGKSKVLVSGTARSSDSGFVSQSSDFTKGRKQKMFFLIRLIRLSGITCSAAAA